MPADRIEFAARYEVLRGGGVYKPLHPYGAPEIWQVSSSELKMSIRGTFLRDNIDGINWLSDRLRVVVILNGVEYPCGVFIITTAPKRKVGGLKLIDIEGYSPLYLAQRKKLETRLHIDAGANYVTQINNLLIASGISDITSTATSLTLATAREDWEIGTPYLTIINQLLAEINYNSVWVNLNGTARVTPYTAPSLSGITQTYKAGTASLIGDDYTMNTDLFDKSNVFMVICQNPDLSAPLIATAENNDASSPFSISNIGRVLSVTQVNNTPNLTALQATANKQRTLSMLSTETVEFITAINPVHTSFDVLALDNDELSGLFEETEWTLTLGADADMRHKAKRVIS